ncbi:MAG: hypothetical protein ACRC10_05425 [Thermoguttaceae bacterium]
MEKIIFHLLLLLIPIGVIVLGLWMLVRIDRKGRDHTPIPPTDSFRVVVFRLVAAFFGFLNVEEVKKSLSEKQQITLWIPVILAFWVSFCFVVLLLIEAVLG